MLFLGLTIVLVILFYALWRKNADYWKKRNVLEVNGIFWKFLFGDRSMPEYFKEIYDSNETHVGLFTATEPTLVVKDLEDIQAILAGDFQSFPGRGFNLNPNDILTDNVLFIDDYKRWRCIRQKLTPVFTSAKLKNMFYILDKCAKDFVDMIDNDANMRENPFNALYTYTTASIGSSVFGIDTKSTKSTMDSPFIEMAWKSVEPSFKANVKFLINGASPKLFNLLNLKIFGEHEDFFVGVVRNVLESRRNSTEKRHDFIEICLELQKEGVIRDVQTGYEVEPTVEVLAAQAFFFFIAGADSTANTLHFFFLQMAGQQEVLAKIHSEIDSVFQNGVQELTYYDIEKMKYLDMALSESMRMYPNLAMLQRKCMKETVLPGSKVKLDDKAVVVISTFGIHRDEKYHPTPDVFDPERFAPENLSKMKSYSYMPFGEGNRICLGNRFARLQLKACIAWTLRRFTLTEKKYEPKTFERSAFSIRDTKTKFQLIRRDV